MLFLLIYYRFRCMYPIVLIFLFLQWGKTETAYQCLFLDFIKKDNGAYYKRVITDVRNTSV